LCGVGHIFHVHSPGLISHAAIFFMCAALELCLISYVALSHMCGPALIIHVSGIGHIFVCIALALFLISHVAISLMCVALASLFM